MTKTLTIIGCGIHDIPAFYAEINRVFMAGEDWTLGESLDGLDDMLRGGYGAIKGRETITLVWRDIAVARCSLGVKATRAFLQAKLERPDVYDAERIGHQILALDRGAGQTYFDIILEIITGHPNIHLVSA